MDGLITAKDGWTYQLTPTDLDWLAREIANEGGSAAATLWTMAQRLYSRRARGETMTAMIRGFSQPINPRWLADGDFCRPGGTYYCPPPCTDTRSPCHPNKLARRATAQAPTTAYPEKIAFVRAWAAGHVPNPVPRANDFRACDDAARELVASGRAVLVLSSGNCYVARDGSQNWPIDMVSVAGAGPAAGGAGGIGAAVAGLLGLFLAWKWFA
jgi:hypothetical protein